LLLDEWAETVFRAPGRVAVSMALMGFGLPFTDRHGGGSAGLPDVGLRDALVIGVSQALALVPGVSRSGATISAALLLGYRRDEAARFSFLLGAPIILGAAP
jgi:undecaprenyl-diphosphatase